MLKVEELNIGSIVSLYGAENNWTTVCDICELTPELEKFFQDGGIQLSNDDKHYVIVGNEKSRVAVLLKHIIPIPLTPALLEQCKVSMARVADNFILFENKSISLWKLMFLNKIQVESFHQLQNIYRFLTKEELLWVGR